jgi:hypothetical protein
VNESVTRVITGSEGNPDWINATGLPDSEVSAVMPQILRETARWSDAQTTQQQKLSMFNRSTYQAPDSPYSLFEVARRAVANDDIVGGVQETSCGLAFQGIKWEADNTDDADVFNQISTALDLDTFIRNWYKEDYTYSQAVVGIWWAREEFKVRGNVVTPEAPHALPNPETGLPTFQPKLDPKTGKPKKPKKTKRKKTYNVVVPIGITMLDPMKVIPLSPTMFGRDRLAWQSNRGEYTNYIEKRKNGEYIDPIMDNLLMGPIDLPREEKDMLSKWGVDPEYLIELNPDYVFRIAPTRTPYERFADIRLKSVLPLLDMKQQLMEADRVSLIGQANYILLVRIGDKDNPAKPEELTGARKGVENLARVPVVVGDYRLQIDIITPDQQWALNPERYNMIDDRILRRCMGAMISPDAVDAGTSSKAIARVLEMKRLMLKRVLEEKIAKAVVEHPANEGKFEAEPNLEFMPRNVQVDSDSQMVQAILSLRTQKELSRESTLDFVGFDQAVEATRRQNEEELGYDEIFGTQVPFSSPDAGGAPMGQSPQMNGFQGGGRPNGGGKTAQSPQKQAQPKTGSGATRKNGGK